MNMVVYMIYKLDNKQFREKLREFGKTVYGKCIFLSCYLPFLFGFIITIIFFLYFNKFNCLWAPPFLISLVFTILSFSIGSYCYYRELRVFINK